MDVSDFKKFEYNSHTCYEKKIGKIMFNIYVGSRDRSSPEDPELDINSYNYLLVITRDLNGNGVCFDELNKMGVKTYGKQDPIHKMMFEKITVPELEQMHLQICKYFNVGVQDALKSISIKPEKPCRGCGRMNDIGSSVCWCCGGPKPTGD